MEQTTKKKESIVGKLHKKYVDEVTSTKKDFEPKTKIIYLDEADRPKEEKPLQLKDWLNTQKIGSSIDKFDKETINSLGEEFIDYRINFKTNDKPIHLSEVNHLEFDLIVVEKGGKMFSCFLDGSFEVRQPGELNSGKI